MMEANKLHLTHAMMASTMMEMDRQIVRIQSVVKEARFMMVMKMEAMEAITHHSRNDGGLIVKG